ncbi:MAG: UbiA family prenyltransferase [Methanomassiliicoccales archaeon]
MNRVAQLFRIGNCLMGIVGLMMGVWVALGTDLVDSYLEIISGAAVVFFFIAGGNALNDYVDREVDKVGHPERPIPSGRMTPETALRISAVCFVVSLLFSLLLNGPSIVVVLVAVALMLLYELRTKKAGLSGNITIGLLTAMLFLLGGTMVDMLDRTYILAALAGLATLGREIVKDIEDMDADFDRNTLPKRIGKRNASIVAAAVTLTAIALSAEPYLAGTFRLEYMLMVLVADAIFIYASVIQFQNPRQGQRSAKYGMLVALSAFLIGGLL